MGPSSEMIQWDDTVDDGDDTVDDTVDDGDWFCSEAGSLRLLMEFCWQRCKIIKTDCCCGRILIFRGLVHRCAEEF